MPRAIKVLAGQRRPGPTADTLILNLDQRRTHRGHVFTVKGTCIELDLEAPVWLRTDDVLVLEDGSLIDIVAEAEPLLEVRAADVQTLARIAWILGDRHVPIQILRTSLRLRSDPAMQTLLSKLAVKMMEIEAPFDPEGGAYAAVVGEHRHDHGDHHHDHGHHHQHGHHHGDHDHHTKKSFS